MRLLFQLFAAAFVCVTNSPASAQDAIGYWEGVLEAGATKLRIGVAIEQALNGEYIGTVDSPDQNAANIPLADIKATKGKLSFEVPSIAASYKAKWDEDKLIWKGRFSQAGIKLPLDLQAGTRPPVKAQPSLPQNWNSPSDHQVLSIIEDRIQDRPGTGMVIGLIEEDASRLIAMSPNVIPPFDDKTVFEIGSMTKVFTALLLADMVLDGTVSLDDPVAKHLPENAYVPARNGNKITLRNLSQHDSGLPRLPENLEPADLSNPYADYTEQHMLDFLAGYSLTRDIGSEYEYSNLGVGLLGYALARADGTDFESSLRARILAPLGMHNTAIKLPNSQKARFAKGRDQYNRPTSAWDLPSLAAAGALRSDAHDMLTFMRAALDPKSPIARHMKLTLADPREGRGFSAGLGWMIENAPAGPVVMHGGGTGGFRTHMALQPDTGRAVVVLFNSAAPPSAQDVAMHLLIGQELEEVVPIEKAPEMISRTETDLTNVQLDRVTGAYLLMPGVVMTIKREGSQLFATVAGQSPMPIYPRSPLEFFWRTLNAEVVFTEEDGRVKGAVFAQDGTEFTMRRVDDAGSSD